MPLLPRAILFLLLSTFGCSMPSSDPKPSLTLADLNKTPVIGQLGIPLGKVVEIEATIVAGRELRMKAYDSAYLLRVTSIGGRTLDPAPVMSFYVAPGGPSSRLANDHFDLSEIKTGTRATSLNDSKIAELEKGYVGQRLKLRAYETGGFSGIPDSIPFAWQDHGWGFFTRLAIVENIH